ncbi:unnamed protein product [Mucor hiemalis]
MAQNILRTSTRVCTAKNKTYLTQCARYSNSPSSWFRRFLSPSEEKELYLGITSSFREKLNEQSTKSTQNYSHIIEHALFTAKPKPTAAHKVSKTGKQKDTAKLQKLELEMDHANLKTVAMYNRLIRSYIWSDSLQLAEQVLLGFEERELVPTTRTYTYLIQAHLKRDQLDNAKTLVTQMQHLSLHHKLRNDFDCNVMLKYYKACGDTHALDFLWRDIALHMDIIKPGIGSFTLYMEHLLDKEELKPISQVTHEFLLNHHQNQQQGLLLHQYVTWMKTVNLLAKANIKKDTQKAERLLLLLIKRAPPKVSWDMAKDAIEQIAASYLKEEQDLKTLAFYYKLQKMGVPDQAFTPEMMQSIENVLKKMEKGSDDRAVIEELEGLVLSRSN